jgi:hypothetical protein
MAGREQKTCGTHGQDVFRNTQLTDIGQSLLVATSIRRLYSLSDSY